MKYNIRFLLPVATEFKEISAESMAEACCTHLGKNRSKSLFVKPKNAGRSDGDTSYFAIMQVEGESNSFVVRYFFGGIGRHGGVKPPQDPSERFTLAEVERDFGLNAGHITDTEWDGEESAVDAWNQKLSEH